MADTNQAYYDAVNLIQDRLIVNNLKNVLRHLRLSSTGRKAILQSRLLDYLSTGIRRDDEERVKIVHDLLLAELNPSAPPQPVIASVYHPALQANRTPNYTAPSKSDAPKKVNFQETPFYKLQKVLGEPVSIVVTLRDVARKSTIRFQLTEDEIKGLQNSTYTVLLMSATASELSAFQYSVLQYPQQLEIRVNSNLMQVNVRGLKNKPGTARAPDLTKMMNLHPHSTNMVEITTQDVQQPFTMMVYLVQPVKMEDIVKEIESRSVISKESTIQKIIDENNDDDVQTISTVLSLKCPLSYCRITMPVRSMYCDHIECFDALSFLMLQQQATTWTCPICNKALKYAALAVDEYLQEILQKTAAYDIDEIEISENGDWKMPKDAKLLNEDDSDYDSDEPAKTEKQTRNSFRPDDADVISLSDSDNDDLPEPVPLAASTTVVAPSSDNTNSAPANGVRNGAENGAHSSNNIEPNNAAAGNAHSNRYMNGYASNNFEDIYDAPLPSPSLLQRPPRAPNAPTSNERAVLPALQRSGEEDIFMSLPGWETSMFNRRKDHPPATTPSTTTNSTITSTVPTTASAPPTSISSPTPLTPPLPLDSRFGGQQLPRPLNMGNQRQASGTWQLPSFNTLVPTTLSPSDSSELAATAPATTQTLNANGVATTASPATNSPLVNNITKEETESTGDATDDSIAITTSGPTKRSHQEVIDLTLSDDDDEPPVKR